jgi:hypothetical protein
METPDANLSKGMRQLNGVYTQHVNRTHDRVGHLFQGRYRATAGEVPAPPFLATDWLLRAFADTR